MVRGHESGLVCNQFILAQHKTKLTDVLIDRETMKPKKAETVLKILFRLNALLLTSAFLTIFLPVAWMRQAHQWLGLGTFPDASITEYLARSCSMMYSVHGLVLLVVSFNLRRYWELIPLLAGVHVLMGALLLGIDIKSGMPWYWTLVEGPGILIFGCALLWLWKMASSDSIDSAS